MTRQDETVQYGKWQQTIPDLEYHNSSTFQFLYWWLMPRKNNVLTQNLTKLSRSWRSYFNASPYRLDFSFSPSWSSKQTFFPQSHEKEMAQHAAQRFTNWTIDVCVLCCTVLFESSRLALYRRVLCCVVLSRLKSAYYIRNTKFAARS